MALRTHQEFCQRQVIQVSLGQNHLEIGSDWLTTHLVSAPASPALTQGLLTYAI